MYLIEIEQLCSQQRKPKNVSNLTFFCNKFRATMKLSIITAKTL